ncbi:TonB-dependent receptor plug domain-containing protein [Hahella ganghwensis]|uniref:TonB-dependent receptor plug domain-containing protein n=1 Tax=Hahella ganghwensis TaxID=286420 RepID=UPI001FDF1EFA|nr:TonB-dependent receptor [Hahella ganghwensis]
MKKQISLLMFSLATMTSPGLMADNLPTTDPQAMNPVVVTGTRSEKLLSDSPVKTEVVSRQDIQSNHARDVKEALEDVPGLLLKRIHRKSGYEVWMQGLDSNRVKVLIDGEPVAASTGSTVDVTQISSLNIERIEVVKGATSALYGSSAMGGVINIITRPAEQGVHYEALAEAGSFGEDNPGERSAEIATGRASGRISIGNPQWYSALNIDARTSEGFDATPGTWTTQGAEGERFALKGSFGWTPDQQQRYEVYADYYREDLTNQITAYTGGKAIFKLKEEEADRIRLGSRFNIDSTSGEWSGSLFHEKFEDETYQDVIATPEKEDRRSAEIETQRATLNWSHQVWEAHYLTSGLEYFRETLEQYKEDTAEVSPGTDRQSFEWLIQDDVFLTENLEIVPGLRLQHDSDFGNYAAPKLNLRQEISKVDEWGLFVRGGVGRGYRVPNLKERHYTFDHSHIGYVVLGNPDLEPESSNSFQLGFGANNGKGAYVDLNFFYNDITDLIETAFSQERKDSRGDGVAVYSYINVAEAETRGVELSAAYPFNPTWRVHGGYTYMESEDKRTGLALIKRPKHQLKAGVKYRHQEWGTELVLNAVYQSEEFTDEANTLESPDWTTMDIKLNQPIYSQLTVFGGIDNITDTQRDFSQADRDMRPEEGRFFYLGLRIEG